MKKQCAVCGTRIQTNIILRWKRFSDEVIFNVCALCGEDGKVNADSVKKEKNKTYTTYEEGR